MPRTLIVGDVHACSAELEELLDRAAVVDGDRVLFVGDLVSRGPDPRRTLQLFRACRGASVMGNHEARLLEILRARGRGENPAAPSSIARLLDELDDRDFAEIEKFPLYRDAPEHDLRVLHAGVVPGTPIERQDPWVLMNLRSITPDGTPSKERDGVPWARLYTDGPHVVFGHDARGGLQLFPRATGLDTGCVYGGALSAMLLDSGCTPPPVADRRSVLVTVPARRAYCELSREG